MAQIPTYEQLMELPPEYLSEDQSYKLLNASIAFLVVQTLVFCGYLTSRWLHKGSNQWSTTGLVMASYLCQLSLSIAGMCKSGSRFLKTKCTDADVNSLVAVADGGMGRHISYWFIHDPPRIRKYLQVQTTIEYLYITAVIVPKLVILSLYLKIFIGPGIRRIAWGLVITLCLYFVLVV
jgi:hypothetical protein